MFSSIRNNLQTVKTVLVDQRKATQRRLKELYREGGIFEVFRGIRDYYKFNVANKTYHTSRTDNEQRWSLIDSYIVPEHSSLVDLGCADGFFIKKAADRGLTVHGIEGNQGRVNRARELCAGYDQVNIKKLYLSPDNISEIPSTDVVLFLTVHHHWIRHYGWESAADMFRYVCDQTNLVFYEPPGNKIIERDGKETPLDPKESIEYYTKEIGEILDKQVTIVDSQMVEYGGRTRSDPIFVLDTADYYC